MKIHTINSTSILSRSIRLIGAILTITLMMPAIAFSQTAPNLGTASSFAVLAAAGISNTGSTVLTGDIGSYPTNTITGLTAVGGSGPGTYSGTNYGNSATTDTAMIDLNTAYLDAMNQAGTITTIASDLASQNLNAGIYNSADGTFGNTGTLTLTGSSSAVFIFRMSTTLITASSSNVILSGGVVWTNVFWQVGSSATLGTSSHLEGTILANTSITANTSATVNGRLLAGAVTSTGAVTLDANTALPVELTSFTAALNNSAVELNWNTATEVNNYGFDIERSQMSEASSQNLTWNKIGFVKGNGNSNSPKNYSFVDNTVSYGSYAYRLKQIDNDGAYKYSFVVEVNSGQMQYSFLLNQNYPNPFNPSTEIQFGVSKNSPATLTIFNVLGEKVATLFNGNAVAGQVYNVTLNGSNLASGIYYYKLQTNDNTEVKKMILMK
ncbi:MAG: ice-binding family protein [Ignavibacteriaceae bacterium]